MNINRVESSFILSKNACCSQAEGGMVASAFPAATDAGAEILRSGGNAVDAAIATAFALCVCEPQACSLGGQSSILLHMNGCSFALEGSGRIPELLNKKIMQKEDVVHGYRATTVPTTPAVLNYAHKRFGKLSWDTVLKPAVRLAQHGYIITELQHTLLKREETLFNAVKSGSGKHYYFKNGQTPFADGDLFIQPELATVLEKISKQGVECFYQGEIANLIDKDMRNNNGFLRKTDLYNIPWPEEKSVIRTTFLNHSIVTMPPPTQGRILILMLNIIETLIKRGITPEHENWPVYLAETMLAGYNGRMAFKQPSYKYIADNDPVLHNRNHIEELSDLIERSAVSKEPWPQLAGGETTHLTVMDDNKNTVCITQSVNMVYGSKTAADGLGFLYNNYLIDCWPFPLDHPFGLNPGGTAPSSVAPFIVMHQGKPWLAAGSPGSQRIVSALTQFLVHVLHEGMSISKAMTMPRMHCQKKGIIAVEQGGFPEEVINSLKRRDYNIEEKPAFYFGAIHATLAKRASSVFQGVAEMRRDGTAKGPK